MRLQFCIAFTVLTLWTFGANGQASSGGVHELAQLLFNRTQPENFLSSTGNSQTCPYSATINCDQAKKFRTIDGSCNNIKSPYMGKSETPFARLYPNQYKDLKREPRVFSYFGGLLPIPRKISNDLFKVTSGESTRLSNMIAVFARFVEHDLYKTKLIDATGCCTTSEKTGVCYNVKVEATDPYFSTYKRVCLPKEKAVSSPTRECKSDVSQQVNQHTHYLDLSNIYGSTDKAAEELRTKTDGLLKESSSGNFLPKYDLKECQLPQSNPKNIHCFLAGDLRANDDPLLMTMYTLWVREHNYIAKEIKSINPKATDETIYQTARKILIAQYQHIVYNEFLTALNSKSPLKPAGSTTVSTKPLPDIANSFAIVFTGLVDSMVRQNFKFDSSTVELQKTWFNPEKLWESDGIKKLVTGMLSDKAEKIDRHVVKPLRDQYLEKVPGQGTDKVAVNLQQSRENGNANYYIMNVMLLKLFNVENYQGLKNLDATAAGALKLLYPEVYDIELLPGVLSEKVATDAQFGVLMKEIVEDQFKRLKEGDAFYYENKDVFTADRLTEIKKISMAKILCRQASQSKPQANVFLLIDSNNAETECDKIKSPNLCIWATSGWTDWVKSVCRKGIIVSTRQCQFLTGGKCQCEGKPFKFDTCPSNIQQVLSPDVKEKLENAYNKLFDSQGTPFDGSQDVEGLINQVIKTVIT